MKITKQTLDQIIKEEIGKIKEAEIQESAKSYGQQVALDLARELHSVNAALRAMSTQAGSLNRENVNVQMERIDSIKSQLYRFASGDPLQGVVEGGTKRPRSQADTDRMDLERRGMQDTTAVMSKAELRRLNKQNQPKPKRKKK